MTRSGSGRGQPSTPAVLGDRGREPRRVPGRAGCGRHDGTSPGRAPVRGGRRRPRHLCSTLSSFSFSCARGSATSVCGGALLLWAVPSAARHAHPARPRPARFAGHHGRRMVVSARSTSRDPVGAGAPRAASRPAERSATSPFGSSSAHGCSSAGPGPANGPVAGPDVRPGSRTSAARTCRGRGAARQAGLREAGRPDSGHRGATTVTSMEPRLEAARRPAMAAPAAAHQAAQDVDGRERPAACARRGARNARSPWRWRRRKLSGSRTLLARDTSDEPLRVSLARVLAQLPPRRWPCPSSGSIGTPEAIAVGPAPDGARPAQRRRRVRAMVSLGPSGSGSSLAVSHEAIASGLPDGQLRPAPRRDRAPALAGYVLAGGPGAGLPGHRGFPRAVSTAGNQPDGADGRDRGIARTDHGRLRRSGATGHASGNDARDRRRVRLGRHPRR